MKKMLIITNHPSPYRVYLFNIMNKIAPEFNIKLYILFMNKMEKRRNWRVETSKMKFNFIILKPIILQNRKIVFYLNTQIKKYIKHIKPDILILGGSWHYFDYFLYNLYFKRIVKEHLYWWTEINIFIKSIFFIKKARDYIFKKINKFIVPGEFNKQYLDKYINADKIVLLPNIINNDYFKEHPINSTLKNILIVSRLEKEKNVINIVKWLITFCEHSKRNISVTIIGDGKQRGKLKTLIMNKNYIKYYNYIDYDRMYEFYRDTDIFILGSLKDPSPLSNIEAISTNNILLISNHCGNLNEVLIEGKNGYSFSPTDEKEFKNKLENIFSWEKNKIINAKKTSKELYKKNFIPAIQIKNFLKNFL